MLWYSVCDHMGFSFVILLGQGLQRLPILKVITFRTCLVKAKDDIKNAFSYKHVYGNWNYLCTTFVPPMFRDSCCKSVYVVQYSTVQ